MLSRPQPLVHRRVYSQAPQAVYAAFADAERLAHWWGPDGFRNHFHVCDFREGGEWRFDMEAPTGQVYPNASRFLRLRPAEELVIRHESVPRFTLTVNLEALPKGTLVTWSQQFDDSDTAAALKPMCEPANEQNLDRLAAVLAKSHELKSHA